MNDLVYYVRGGMEDWAYAGSWDPDRVIKCDPQTYDGYDPEKSVYNNSTLRVFNMLIETSHSKIPQPHQLGTSEKVLTMDTPGNGHVSRNIRLALTADDLVEPYASVVGVNELALSDDLVPLTARSCPNLEHDKVKEVVIAQNLPEIKVEWSVGGALHIDETMLWYAKVDDVPAGTLDCVTQPDTDAIQKIFSKATLLTSSKGTGFFSQKGPKPLAPITEDNVQPVLGPVFTATVSAEGLTTGDKIVLLASARVDKDWMKRPKNVGPDVPPQAHIVNVRNDPTWHHESANKIIQGRLHWFSVPVVVMVGDYDDSVGSQAGRERSTIESNNRFGESHGQFHGGVTPSKTHGKAHKSGGSGSGGSSSSSTNSSRGIPIEMILIGSFVVIVAVSVVVMSWWQNNKRHQEIAAQYHSEGTAMGIADDSDEEDGDDADSDSDIELSGQRNGLI